MRGLAEVVLRIWGLMLLVRAAIDAPRYAMSIHSGFVGPDEVGMIASLILRVGASAILLLFARSIAVRIAGQDDDAPVNLPLRDALVLGISLVALYFLLSGAREVVAGAYTLATKGWDESPVLEYLWRQRRDTLLSGAFECVVGGVLLRGRNALAERLAASEQSSSS